LGEVDSYHSFWFQLHRGNGKITCACGDIQDPFWLKVKETLNRAPAPVEIDTAAQEVIDKIITIGNRIEE
jgi:hypothetical protein